MAKSTMDRPEIETLEYHSPLCKCPECEKNPVPKPEQPKCKICGGTKQVYAEHAGEPYSKECPNCSKQPKDNPGPLEKLIVDRIEHDLENIAANLEMLNPETKEQNRAKCVLTLEMARITGEGGMFDDLKEAFE